ncbi:MAG: DUF4115 domain-containing protein [Luteitalea sp.]|nr:DUF4115 domain-containing protein [Luteitalea sp.]
MTFSDHLREARERRGITLRQISEQTNIAVRLLEALERGEIDKLPGGIFSRGFVRAYAREVGLDPTQAVDQFLAECAQYPVDETRSPAAGTPEDHARAVAAEAGAVHRRTSSLQAMAAMAGGLCLFALIGYGMLQLFGRPDPVEQPRQPRPIPVSQDAPTVEPLAGASSAARPEGVTVKHVRSAGAAEQLTIDIQPQAPCWVRLVVDGRVAFARLLEPGERVVHQAEERFVVRVGDAAAFQYTLNDIPGRPLGAAGEVVTARIDRNNFDRYIVRQ